MCRQLCVDKLCVDKSERRRGGEAEVQNQKQEPHTKMWAKILLYFGRRAQNSLSKWYSLHFIAALLRL